MPNQSAQKKRKRNKKKQQQENKRRESIIQEQLKSTIALGGIGELKALKQSLDELNVEIENLKKFDGETYIMILVVSMIKDVIDPMDFGVATGMILNSGISVFLFVKLFGHHAMTRRMLIFIGFEFMPFVNIAPIYTIAAIWIKMSVDKEISNLEHQVEDIEEEIKKKEKIMGRFKQAFRI